MIIVMEKGKKNFIGRLGENESRTLCFNIKDIVDEFPDATFTILNKRSADPDAYPVNGQYVEIDGDNILWTLQSGDLAYKGDGECQVNAYQNNAIVKTETYSTYVEKALDGNRTPPEPWESWVEQVNEAADRAEDAVAHNPVIIDGIWYTWDPDSGEYVSTGVEAKGDKGDPGEPGERGEKGDSVLKGTLISGDDYIIESEVSE